MVLWLQLRLYSVITIHVRTTASFIIRDRCQLSTYYRVVRPENEGGRAEENIEDDVERGREGERETWRTTK